MDASLQAYLGGPCRSRFYRAARHLFEFEIVGRPAQVLGTAAFGKRAETTVVQADVGVVDVAIDDIRNRVAHRLAAQLIRRGDHLVEIAAFDTEEANDVGFGERVAGPRGFRDGADSRRARADCSRFPTGC